MSEAIQPDLMVPPSSVLRYTSENVKSLAVKLRNLRDQNKIRFKALIVDAGLVEENDSHGVTLAQQRFSRWIKKIEIPNKWKTLKEENYRKIILYLYRNAHLWPSTVEARSIDAVFPDAAYHGLRTWFNMSTESHEELKSEFCGEYAIYRHSAVNIGYVLVGRLEISYDKETDAIKTKEKYTTQEAENLQATDSELTGYMFKRNGKLRILSKDVATDELQYIFLNDIERDGGLDRGRRVSRMMGVVTDIQGNKPYSTRISFIRQWAQGELSLKAESFDQLKENIQELIGGQYRQMGAHIVFFR